MLRECTKERKTKFNNRRRAIMEDLKFISIVFIVMGSAIFACYQAELASNRVEDKNYCLQRVEQAPSTETFCNKLLENYYGD